MCTCRLVLTPAENFITSLNRWESLYNGLDLSASRLQGGLARGCLVHKSYAKEMAKHNYVMRFFCPVIVV